MKALATALLAIVTTGASWIDRDATAREGARLYAAGKFAEAAAKYHEALVEDPDSPLLHYNAAAASYRQGKFDETVATLGRMPASDADPARTARAAYNAGNATYRLGAAAESSNPQEALQRYAEALVAYRRAMGADPADEDAKFNHELVERKIADLKKKLEEQQQQQQQKQKQNQQPPPNQDRQQGQQGDQQQQQQSEKQEQQPGEQPQGERQQAQDQQPAQPAPADAQQERQQAEAGGGDQDHGTPQPQPAGGGDAVAGEPPQNEMSQREAEALLDGQRDQEVRPDEVVRQLQGARVAEPGEDW